MTLFLTLKWQTLKNVIFPVGPGGVSSEESAESSEEDGLPSGHRGSVVAASGAVANNGQQHSIRQPITTLLGHQVRSLPNENIAKKNSFFCGKECGQT